MKTTLLVLVLVGFAAAEIQVGQPACAASKPGLMGGYHEIEDTGDASLMKAVEAGLTQVNGHSNSLLRTSEPKIHKAYSQVVAGINYCVATEVMDASNQSHTVWMSLFQNLPHMGGDVELKQYCSSVYHESCPTVV